MRKAGWIVCVLWGALARAEAPRVFRLQSAQSAVSWATHHKLHDSVGVSHQAEGAAQLLPDGTLQAMVRARIDSFDSQNANRDSHMREVTEAAKFPLVTFKGVTKVAVPTSFPATLQVTLEAELEFHGQKRKESVPATLTFAAPNRLHVASRFDVSLDAYKVERPSLLMMPIDDACRMSVELQLVEAESKPAAAPPSGTVK